MKQKMTFALCFCNRGFMPGELIYVARDDMVKAVTDAGYDYIMMDKELTRYGGVETRDEGLLYAKWLKEHEGQYDGVIFSMPIFADENGAITALQDAGVPILMQAYPDEIGKMDFAHRRDAYCGKFSVTDVFCQYNVPFTVLKPHVVHPLSAKFQENLRDFAAICRVVNGMKRFNLGCIGARTTAFKTVRFDELAMQKNGINVESFDLSEVFEKVRAKADDDAVVLAKLEHLKNYTDFSKVPASNALTLAKVSVVLDEYIEEYHLDALALRCWNEMETYLRICPCVLLSELNDRGIVASCEIDMCSAISMRAMSLASEGPAAVLDWNNNYGDDEDKIILFHCGPVAQSLMAGKGTVTEHKMFAKNDPGSGWGCNEGRIKPMPITISNCQTKDGKIVIYASEAKFTDDPIEDGFFGCGGGEFGADVVGIAAVAGLPVFCHRSAGGAEVECDRCGNIASVLQRQRFAVCAVDLLQNEQIYGDCLCAASVLCQNDMAFHVDLAGLHGVRVVVQNRFADQLIQNRIVSLLCGGQFILHRFLLGGQVIILFGGLGRLLRGCVRRIGGGFGVGNGGIRRLLCLGGHRVGQEADREDDAGDDGRQNDPEGWFFVVHNRFDTLLYSDLAEGEGAGRNSAAVDAARDERLHIIGSLLAAQFSDHGFIARQLDIPAQQHIAEPHHRVEPVDRQQQEAQRLPQVVAPAQVRLLVGNDVLPVAAVHAIWEINSRTDRTEHERRINPLRLVDVSPQADRLAYPVPQPQRADQGIQNEHKDTE